MAKIYSLKNKRKKLKSRKKIKSGSGKILKFSDKFRDLNNLKKALSSGGFHSFTHSNRIIQMMEMISDIYHIETKEFIGIRGSSAGLKEKYDIKENEFEYIRLVIIFLDDQTLRVKNLLKDSIQLLKEKKYKKEEKITVTKEEFCNKLGWNQNKPIVAILASDLTDGVFDNTWSLFRDRLTWLRETLLQIKNINSVNWIVKPHPNDEKHRVVTDTISEYKKICLNYKHILPFPNNVSIASVPKFSHSVITMGGSASWEYPCFGIPVLQACESICSGRGFTIDPGSKNEYFDLLNKIEKINMLNKDQIDQAKIYAFIISKLTRINVNLVASHDIRSMNDKTFWSKMIKLVDNYNEEEDLLKKMMKIQEKNNDRHAINYNLLK